MKIDKEGRDFIYKHEGVRLKAYLDVAGVPTIGVGFTYYPGGKKVAIGDTITQAQCDSMFTAIVASYEQAVTKAVKIPINQHQFNSLVSFSFNVGNEALAKSTLLKLINTKSSFDLIKSAFLMWDKAGGKIVQDLLQRRKDEAALYNKSSTDETVPNP
ncbi:lysozyme [Mucilaginibacter sp.]|uniref:lysozyme n=1 Tax=Mucilaginibacter sp. TaxID=1882438 RepID=UPI003D1100B4